MNCLYKSSSWQRKKQSLLWYDIYSATGGYKCFGGTFYYHLHLPWGSWLFVYPKHGNHLRCYMVSYTVRPQYENFKPVLNHTAYAIWSDLLKKTSKQPTDTRLHSHSNVPHTTNKATSTHKSVRDVAASCFWWSDNFHNLQNMKPTLLHIQNISDSAPPSDHYNINRKLLVSIFNMWWDQITIVEISLKIKWLSFHKVAHWKYDVPSEMF
jgi:hypothetical protein